MGLNLVLYDLRQIDANDWNWDTRFDLSRHGEDYAFVRWLHAKNAVFSLRASQKELDLLRQMMNTSADESLEHALENTDSHEVLDFFIGDVFERPKDFAAARRWVHDYSDPYVGHA